MQMQIIKITSVSNSDHKRRPTVHSAFFISRKVLHSLSGHLISSAC